MAAAIDEQTKMTAPIGGSHCFQFPDARRLREHPVCRPELSPIDLPSQ